MKKLLLVLTIMVSICNHLKAQEVIYFSKDSSASKPVKKNRSEEQNIIKVAPLAFLSGSIPVYFEREINHFFSIQAGAGITTRNYLREWVNNLEFNKPEYSKTTWNGTTSYGENMNSMNDFANRKSSIGYSFSIQPRIYFESEGMNGSFIALSYDRLRYNFSSQKIETGPSVSGEPEFTSEYFKEHENISDIAVSFGSQTLYDRISVEYAIGMALRKVDGIRYAYTLDDFGGYIDGVSEVKKTSPAFIFSFKLGYHF
jgi:hypothetical protein